MTYSVESFLGVQIYSHTKFTITGIIIKLVTACYAEHAIFSNQCRILVRTIPCLSPKLAYEIPYLSPSRRPSVCLSVRIRSTYRKIRNDPYLVKSLNSSVKIASEGPLLSKLL